MTRLRAWADWPERALRAVLWRLEERLALTTAALLILIVIVAVLWWDSSDAVRNFGLIAGGVAAGALAIWRSRVAERQAATAERARLDARFELGLRMFQDRREIIRLDGLAILGRLLDEYPAEYGEQIVELLDRRGAYWIEEDSHDDH